MSIVFLDTETTGLHDDRRAWEISLIRRDPDASLDSITIFVAVEDLDLDHASPEALAVGRFHQRHPAFGADLQPGEYLLSERDAAALVEQWTTGAEILGIRPRFDTDTLANTLHRHGRVPRWWRDPIDITDLARGWVLAHGELPKRNPEALSRQCAVAIPEPHLRHTALGDADWVRRWFDALHAGVGTAAVPSPSRDDSRPDTPEGHPPPLRDTTPALTGVGA